MKQGLDFGGCLNFVNLAALVERFSIFSGADFTHFYRVERLFAVYLSE